MNCKSAAAAAAETTTNGRSEAVKAIMSPRTRPLLSQVSKL